jgi:hypothetical protein
MSCREATSDTQRIGPVGKQLDVREIAAEGREVPGAVDVGQGLEQADDADREQRCDRKECSRPPQLPPASAPIQRACAASKNRARAMCSSSGVTAKTVASTTKIASGAC